MKFSDLVTKTKFKLISHKEKSSIAFFTGLVFITKFTENEEIQSIATDGLDIIINPQWFESIEQEERNVAVMNAVLHIALLHPSRKKARDPQLWSKASNINTSIILQDYDMLPHIPEMDIFRDKTTEVIYEMLYQKPEDKPKDQKSDTQINNPGSNQKQEDGQGKGQQGDGTPQEGQGQASASVEQQVQDKLNDVKTQMQMGSNGFSPDGLPDSMKKIFDELSKPKAAWNIILARFLNQASKNNYSWRKPNRRFFPEFHLPSLYSEGLDRIDFVIDTSGSISEDNFKQFLGEINKVLKQFKPKEIGLSQFDHKYRGTEIINEFTDLRKVQIKGGGGTRIESTMEAVDEFNTKCIIIFTDGYMNLDMPKPKHEVIWIVYDNDNFVAPFGKAITYDIYS